MPFRLFRNLRWVAMVICLASKCAHHPRRTAFPLLTAGSLVGANQFYALALVWPRMISLLWNTTGEAYGWMSCIPGAGLIIGQVCGAVLANYVNPKVILVIGTTGGTALLAAAACANEHNMGTVLGVLIPGFLLIGAQEAVCGTFATISLWDQRDIGSAGGLAGTIRSGASALGSVIYGAVLTNRLVAEVPKLIPPAAIQAGLPASSVPALLLYLAGTGKESAVKGLTPQILGAAVHANRVAASHAIRDVMLVTLVFGGVSMIMAWFTPKIDKSKAKMVARTLEKKQEGTIQAEKVEELV